MSASTQNISIEWIKSALEQADPMALRPVVAMLAENDEAVQQRLRAMDLNMADFFLVSMPAIANQDDVSWLKDKTAELLDLHLRRGSAWPTLPKSELLEHLMVLAFGDPVPEENVPYWREELGVDPMPRQYHWSDKTAKEDRSDFHVLVIGAGYAGINAGIQLQDAGLSYTIIEKNPGVGGTWYQNHYPGARVDYPSRLYSYTFQADYAWKHHFAPQQELRNYLNEMVDHYGVRSAIQFEEEVTGAKWLEDEQKWLVSIRDKSGQMREEKANLVISAVGLFDRPHIPDFNGMDDFEGDIFHSIQWPDELDISDKHVVIVGSGATALQIAATVAKLAKKMTVFQRTPPWMVPWPGYDSEVTTEQQWLFDNVPYYLNWVRLRASYALGDNILGKAFDVDPNWEGEFSVNEFTESVRERLTAYRNETLAGHPDLLEKCTPHYTPLANRFVVDAGWYEALKNGSAHLVADGVKEITKDGLISSSGEKVPCDVIVMATGFRSNDFLWPMDIVGRHGKTLPQVWSKDGGRAYLGMAVPDFPNMFIHYGPNSNPRAGTPPMWAEIQMRYILGVIERLIGNGQHAVAVKQQVYDDHARKADEILARSIWMDQRQKSYYRNDFNRVATNSPWKTIDYWRWTLEPDMQEYEIT